MASLTLYHASPSRSSIVRWMLEEIGEPYDLEIMNLGSGIQRQAEYRKINPMGKVPALRHGDTIVTEGAAICTYLADEYPQAGLNVPIGDPARGPYLKWLFFSAGCLEPAMMDKAYPRQETPFSGMLGYGSFDLVLDVLRQAVSRGDFLLGEKFSAADIVLGSNIRWGMIFGLLPQVDELEAYVKRLEARPALQRALALDQELAPKPEEA
ncbi:Glutathione S-transferase GST-6.0 [Methyloligella halotolerans]|uniref:Glutathione S-transferase GST-6.0 n=1 Tax=Methyloligella halotolerans TaxID=1177755 RepID=A0A1E2S327_9HYPH|nr:glutathione S-transferase family protein [Methyloligella halotolerans]ODA68735.1 Glutathione S-transferase GST-6.0 [Methyloligella halotolerans]